MSRRVWWRKARRARPHVEAVGEDEPRPGLARRHRDYRKAGLPRRPRGASASTSSATAARPASATWPACRSLGRREERRPRRHLGAVRQPQLRGPRTPEVKHELRPRRRSSSPTRSPERWISTSRTQPLGTGSDGKPVLPEGHLAEPPQEVRRRARSPSTPAMFRKTYASVFDGRQEWQASGRAGKIYEWDGKSTYVQNPPFFVENMTMPRYRHGHRRRAWLRCSATRSPPTASPAGNIAKNSPARSTCRTWRAAGRLQLSTAPVAANHEVMMRGTFANIRLQATPLAGRRGAASRCTAGGEQMSIYDADDAKYKGGHAAPSCSRQGNTAPAPSRDWAARGTMLGVLRRSLRASSASTART